jgi:hypothetical protein
MWIITRLEVQEQQAFSRKLARRHVESHRGTGKQGAVAMETDRSDQGVCSSLTEYLIHVLNVIWKPRRGRHLDGVWAHWQVEGATGSAESKAPRPWSQTDQAKDFPASLIRNLNGVLSAIWKSSRGRDLGGVRVRW